MSQTLVPHRDGFWTAEDLASLPEDEQRYEIIDGQLMMVPAPGIAHQRIVARLQQLVRTAIDSPLDCVENIGIDLSPSYRIPDLVVFDTTDLEPRAIKLAPSRVVLAVEVVSPSSVTNDRITKPAQYAAARIPAYWRVETEGTLLLTACTLHDDTYAEVGTWREGETADLVEPFLIRIEVDSLVP